MTILGRNMLPECSIKYTLVAEEWKTNLMSLAILFHFLCAQHVSDINISIIRSLRLCCWITCAQHVSDIDVSIIRSLWLCCWISGCNTDTTQTQSHQISNTQRTENKTTDVIQQHSRKLLMMDILMSETCWAHEQWNKIASDIKLVFHSSTSNKSCSVTEIWGHQERKGRYLFIYSEGQWSVLKVI